MLLAIVIASNEVETVWNAFRLGNHALKARDQVEVFLLGRGVEAEQLKDERFDVPAQMEAFVNAGGTILACGTCLKIRQRGSTELCPLSTMADLHAMIQHADKLLTF